MFKNRICLKNLKFSFKIYIFFFFYKNLTCSVNTLKNKKYDVQICLKYHVCVVGVY